MDQNTNSKPRVLKGTVVSDKMQKTAVVEVLRLKKHPKYKKYFKVSRRFKAHNPENTYHTGDQVFMSETKPMSKDKRWVIISKAE
ncbi:MAG: 30S ribosomal protein S17 [Candidatus Yanofskybacteria bacterium RIFCSPHIGHO2_02_FULL_44_12b]|uniref:Small ribosomal subunit protein uS17 n=2 Tax=Candidatus Yanofskyibacteriota TaxID=1752733 RepID=A0A1F8GK98_9BACT|nr:MAG: 30S ribosomal protein S17 [Candidatus Yanofskybacteria bacterium GW2011_GWA2_44_9]OGN04821.1 MAG: 30S ribosomal protein S17 [Candidatus Yanofskybacteria bacterium RIFCSPHIGHO2_01_FULL_44_24]OGN16067.1 MAG: 30S ribosomal protein S17 [Candidatus Yanofskybacteria bacterium RIFCSPHIGHO2_02_FULL_44_12b]OGN25138.1 MAG: 30S ribosomal protein S17 [Candidatus Yanofskybacteria bacterium RIFCSPLOWO2_01_FULL_44_22]